ncbi:hypothetical protein AB0H88_16190 [Nonomuraea sp. NPDC050680]|uniref:hypothetical protein n=1 Tax=Nonomuraea sp. NPDC050680 TaxID=3154630 RepID=UPI0033FF2942
MVDIDPERSSSASGAARPLFRWSPPYDVFEQTWSAPMPFLFQRRYGSEDRALTRSYIRERLIATSAAAQITIAGQPLDWRPHDFRRIFVTDAAALGPPTPHRRQDMRARPARHHDGLRHDLPRRRHHPPPRVHRPPPSRTPQRGIRDLTAGEWEGFLSHFELRKVVLGVCGRDYGTPCAHENACVRCPLLRVDPAQKPRLEEIHANLIDRLAEAKQQGWLGEAEGLRVSLAATEGKLAQRSPTSRPAAPRSTWDAALLPCRRCTIAADSP